MRHPYDGYDWFGAADGVQNSVVALPDSIFVVPGKLLVAWQPRIGRKTLNPLDDSKSVDFRDGLDLLGRREGQAQKPIGGRDAVEPVFAFLLRLNREDASWSPETGYDKTKVTPFAGYFYADANWGRRYNAGLSYERYQQPTSTEEAEAALAELLAWAGHRPENEFDPQQRREDDIDRLADSVETHLDLDLLARWLPRLPARCPRATVAHIL